MDKTYDSGHFELILTKALTLAGWKGFDARARRCASPRALARSRHGRVSRMDRRRRVRRTRDGHRRRATATSRSFRPRRRWGRGSRPRTRNSRSTCSACRSIASASCRATPTAARASAAQDRARCSSAARRSRSAAERTVVTAQELAAKELGAAASDIEYLRRRVQHRRHRSAHRPVRRSRGGSRGAHPLDSMSSVADATWPNGCHICEVEIDPETGARRHRRVLVGQRRRPGRQSDDRRGQLDGGAVQGIGQALCEQLRLRRRIGPGADRQPCSTTRCRARR